MRFCAWSTWGLAVAALAIGFTADYVWARWSRAAADKKPFAAANWSVLIYICGLFYFVNIIHGCWLVVAGYLVGSYAGTYFGVRHG